MPSIFFRDPVYISIDEVKDSTSKPAIAGLTDDEIKILITKAQREVDSYIGTTFRPSFVSGQEFLFPVLSEDASYLPEEIKEATLYVLEQVYVSGDTIVATLSGPIVEEKTGPHTVKYGDSSFVRGSLIPDLAKKILDRYRNNFSSMVL